MSTALILTLINGDSYMRDNKETEEVKILSKRLKQAKEKSIHGKKEYVNPGSSKNIGIGIRVGLEMVASLIVGGGLGWFLDDFFDTKPWLFLVFLLLGLAAGFKSILKIIKYL